MSNARLNLQQLGSQADQVLVVGRLASMQTDDGVFSGSALESLFVDLKVPPPSNVHHVLSVLSKRKYVMKVTRGNWAITPVGEARLGDIGVEIGRSDLGPSPNPALGGAEHYTIPPELAPASLRLPIQRFLDRSAFTQNVFGITRFPEQKEQDHPLRDSLSTARRALEDFGLTLHLASDRSVEDQLWQNVAGSMWACHYGLVILEERQPPPSVEEGEEKEPNSLLNGNVLIETGAMLMAGRRCVILRDTSVSKIPTDLIGHIYKEIDLSDSSTVEAAVREWCSDDLALGDIAN